MTTTFTEWRRDNSGTLADYQAEQARANRTTEQQFFSAVRAEIARVKADSFVADYQATDAEALGIALAHFAEWDGAMLLRTAQYALEDANFHTESAIVGRMADHAEAGEPQPG